MSPPELKASYKPPVFHMAMVIPVDLNITQRLEDTNEILYSEKLEGFIIRKGYKIHIIKSNGRILNQIEALTGARVINQLLLNPYTKCIGLSMSDNTVQWCDEKYANTHIDYIPATRVFFFRDSNYYGYNHKTGLWKYNGRFGHESFVDKCESLKEEFLKMKGDFTKSFMEMIHNRYLILGVKTWIGVYDIIMKVMHSEIKLPEQVLCIKMIDLFHFCFITSVGSIEVVNVETHNIVFKSRLLGITGINFLSVVADYDPVNRILLVAANPLNFLQSVTLPLPMTSQNTI
jgi:hypothetical protein